MFLRKRRIARRISLMLLGIFLLSFWGCNLNSNQKGNNGQQNLGDNFQGLTVRYLEVYEGNCILITLPDGLTLLLDCGINKNQSPSKFIQIVKNYCSNIQYFILSNLSDQALENAKFIIENFGVKRLFVPHLHKEILQYFPKFCQLLNIAGDKGILTQYSYELLDLSSSNYKIVFLTPSVNQGAYSRLVKDPLSVQARKDISPIIYLEYMGVKFVFTGEAGILEQQLAVNKFKLNLFGDKVDLNGIDYLLVPDHGNSNAVCREFIDTLCPENAIIITNLNDATISDSLLTYLEQANPDYNLYLTDFYGDIQVSVDKLGKVSKTFQR